MSALERPAEVLLVALFDAADRAEAAARAFLHSGLDAGRVALLARGVRGTAFGAVPRAAVLRLPGVGRVVARGALARSSSPPARSRELGRLGVALRRVGLSATDVPRLERAIHRGQSRRPSSWGRPRPVPPTP